MSLSKKIYYSIGNLAASLAGIAFGTYITFYYIDILGVSPKLIGNAMIISGIWNAINDPLLGHISDRTKTKKGRRIPYIRLGAFPLAIAFTFLWIPPMQYASNGWIMFWYFLFITFIYDGLYTLVILNWTSLLPEMYKTHEERTQVSTIRQIFGIIGSILGVGLAPMIFDRFGWNILGIIFGVLIYLSLLASLLGSKEDPTYSEGEKLSILDALFATYSNKSFLFYVLGVLFLQFTFNLIQATLPFYSKYILKISSDTQGLISGLIFISAAIFVSIWMVITNRIGSKNTMLIALSLFGIALIPFWFITSVLQTMIAALFLGFGLAGLMILQDVLISDVIDEDELKTGARREGMYFGINGFMIRITISIQAFITSRVLMYTNYQSGPDIDVQPHSAILGIRAMFSFIPLVAVILSFIFFIFYPLHGKRLTEVKTKLKELHQERN